ncbi:hypothetical protein [Mycobacterium simiae]|uniref:hypothetical protein n=1 Tax=Mycobacterium simiae TaxID=1784 RepID=UPI00165F25BA|nr:hypothetical protein [Mycobacterium simiae]
MTSKNVSLLSANVIQQLPAALSSTLLGFSARRNATSVRLFSALLSETLALELKIVLV